MGDTWALAGLFEASALLVGAEGQSIRGNAAIAREALATWHGERSYVADPRWVNQARDIALIVAERSINVVRRDRDGGWRYAIILLPVDTLLVAARAVAGFLADVKAGDDVLRLADRYMGFREFNELIGVSAQMALADRYAGETA